MKIGIIAEFNPFHNGHIYLINKIKEIFKDPEIIVALSCDYVQRGEIACLPFEVRKNIALEYGATKVVELDFLHLHKQPIFLLKINRFVNKRRY